MAVMRHFYFYSKLVIKYLQILGLYEFLRFWFSRALSPNRLLRINTANSSPPIHLRCFSEDRKTFEKIFVWMNYAGNQFEQVKTVIDCGANIGIASIFFAQRFPNAKIVALEPNEGNFDLLLRNTQLYPNIIPLKAAIWAEDTFLSLDNPGVRTDSFRYVPAKHSSGEEESKTDIIGLAPAYSLRTIIDKYFQGECIDLLKIDIEGAEETVLATAVEAWIYDVENIICEFHSEDGRKIGHQVADLFGFKILQSGEDVIFRRGQRPRNLELF